jgi:hypothetical protein
MSFIDMHDDHSRLWVAAETAIICADYNTRLIDLATKTLEKHCTGKACLTSIDCTG